MKHLKLFEALNESISTSTNLSEIEKIATGQKYKFNRNTGNNYLSFTLEVNNIIYSVSLYEGGEFVIFKSTSEKVIKGNWFTTNWGTTFEYKDKKGEKISSAGTGLNAMDMPIGWGVLGMVDGWTAKIKSSTGSFVPMTSKYSPSSQKCISPKTLDEITNGKCILTIGSKGDTVKTVQSSLNFVLSKEALDLLSGNTYNKDIISNVKEIDMEPDGIFGKITKEAVQEFQKLKGGMKVDGVVGKDTLVNLIKVKEEIIKKEKEALDIEIKKIDTLPMKEIEEINLDNKEEEEIDLLSPIDVQIEIEKTLKELRKEKKDSKRKRRLLKKLERLQKRENKVQNKIDKISESLLNSIIDYDTFIINEGFFDKLFGKPTVDDAAHDSVRGQGWSHRGKDEENYIMFKGEKFYQDQIEYDDYDSTKPIPRIEGEKLIVANPAWSL
jgi:peptidoglycan hydrolase-like protein with peptidoglycan-binding domain